VRGGNGLHIKGAAWEKIGPRIEIEQGAWKLGNEGLLEVKIMQDIPIVNQDWLFIGRQVRTSNCIPRR
jgi:hypothetical protein